MSLFFAETAVPVLVLLTGWKSCWILLLAFRSGVDCLLKAWYKAWVTVFVVRP
jgi:hypothetical protein